MKNKWKSALSVVLCASLLLGGVGVTSYAKNKAESKKTVKKESVEKTKNTADKNEGNDETLYVFSDASGEINKIVVSDKVREQLGNSIAKDDENLLGMKDDIPVTMKVSYKLDGREISPEELAGKSGHVIIHYDYKNTNTKRTSVGGRQQNVYIPYVMLTGMILDNNVFSNVEVSNGKVLDDGERTIVAGIALPGIQENLKISEKDLEIPDSVEIKADVTNFEMMETMTVATNEIFSDMDASKLNNVDDLKDQMNQLSDGIAKLMDGSGQLNDGLTMLNEKTSGLAEGVSKLTNGVDALYSGAESLDQGAAQLNQGAEQLASGLAQLSSKNQELIGGATKVFNTLLQTASGKLQEAGIGAGQLTIDNYEAVLNQVIQSLDKEAVYAKALSEVTQGVQAKRPEIEKAVTEVVKQKVMEGVKAKVREGVVEKAQSEARNQVTAKVLKEALGMTVEQYEQAVANGSINEEQQKQIAAQIDQIVNSKEVQAQVDSKVENAMQSKEVAGLITMKTEEMMQSADIKAQIQTNTELQVKQKISEIMASEEIQNKLQAASEGAKSVIQLKASLDSYNSFYLGLITYTNGVSKASEGANSLLTGIGTLKGGTQKLFAGSKELKNGVSQLAGNTPALVDGVSKLKNGSDQLDAGLKEYNERGIEKLVNAVNGDIGGLIDRIKGMINVSQGVDKPVKIIYRTSKIAVEE